MNYALKFKNENKNGILTKITRQKPIKIYKLLQGNRRNLYTSHLPNDLNNARQIKNKREQKKNSFKISWVKAKKRKGLQATAKIAFQAISSVDL